jgi:hypothetical protein
MSRLGGSRLWMGLDKNFAQVRSLDFASLRSGLRQRAQTPARRLILTRVLHRSGAALKTSKLGSASGPVVLCF